MAVVFCCENESDIVVAKKTKTQQAIENLVENIEGNSGVVKKTTHVVKNTTKNRGEKRKIAKVARNKNQHTPSDKWYGDSYEDTKTKLKIYYEHHPEAHIKFIEDLAENAGKNPKWAALVVAMTGGTDPTETKITGEVAQVIENPLNQLTIEELRTLKALKQTQTEPKSNQKEPEKEQNA